MEQERRAPAMEAFAGWEAAQVTGKRGRRGREKGGNPASVCLGSGRFKKMGGSSGAEDAGSGGTRAG